MLLTPRLTTLVLVAIVTLAVYLRLADLDLAEFKRDEAALALMTLDLLAGRALPLTAIGTSVPGLDNGPLMVYLLALPLAVARDAAFASGFVGLMNVAALIVSTHLTERVFGRIAALFAALLYAVGSWAVLFSRKLWPNEAMPLFSSLLVVALYYAVVGGRPGALIAAGVCLGALLNLHPSGIIFAPLVGLALLLRPSLFRTRAVFLTAAAVLLISTPFLYHQVREGFPALRAVQATTGAAARFDGGAFELGLALVGPQAYGVVTGDAIDEFRSRVLPLGPLEQVLPLLVVLGAAVAGLQLVRAVSRRSGWRSWALALLWLIVPLAFASGGPVSLQIHYLIAIVPLLFPFVGLALAAPIRLARAAPVPARTAAAAIPILVALWAVVVQVQHFVEFFDFVRIAGARTPYGTPLTYQRTAADRATQYAAGRPIALVSQPPAGAAADDLPPVWRFLVPGSIDLRFDDGGGALRLTPETTLYAVAPSADSLVREMLDAHGTPAGRGVALPGLDRGYEFWRATARSTPRSSPPLARLEEGLTLDGARYPVRLDHPEIEVVASWRFGEAERDHEWGFFAQLLDDRGGRLTGTDRGGVEAWRLQAGDELITWARFPTPANLAPGRYWIAVGAYETGSVRRLSLLGEDNKPTRDTIRLGPLKVPMAVPVAGASEPIARFGGAIALEAATLPPSIKSGAPLPVDLTWRALDRPDRDLTVFVHLIDEAGRLAAQSDRQPAGGAYPTSIWDAGEQIADRHELRPPPGRYRVHVGLYDATSLERLDRTDAPGGAAEIGTIEVLP